LYDGQVTAGATTFVWDATDNTGRAVASGVYFYRLTASGIETSRKMMFLK
jgi:flagellar hook assembly protein FlgD